MTELEKYVFQYRHSSSSPELKSECFNECKILLIVLFITCVARALIGKKIRFSVDERQLVALLGKKFGIAYLKLSETDFRYDP